MHHDSTSLALAPRGGLSAPAGPAGSGGARPPRADGEPVFRADVRFLAGYVAVWTLVGGFFFTHFLILNAQSRAPIPWTGELAISLTEWLVRAVLSLPILALVSWRRTRHETWGRTIRLHLPASVAFAVGKIALCTLVLMPRLDFLPKIPFHRLLVSEFHFDVATYWIVLGSCLWIDHYRRLQRKERESTELMISASRLEAQLTRARLDTLKMQLQPHFLFNALNTIAALIPDDPRTADRMVERLSQFLRLVLEHAEPHEVTLREEMVVLHSYLEIQQIRFEERLRTRLDIEPDALPALVPNLILQPLVENAIRHGIERRSSGGEVEIRARRRDGMLELQVRDDGPGSSSSLARRDAGLGIGLSNTRARLQQMYGALHTFRLEDRPEGGVAITMSFPYRTRS